MGSNTGRAGAPGTGGARPACFFSDASCRDCALFRGRHWFLCHPGSRWEAVCRGNRERGAREPWHVALFDRRPVPPPSPPACPDPGAPGP
ncbi:MAG: hypothetical protein MUC63_09065 [Planctomycetes bacterium]|jgi:hypothetical protein|nr:hypothetical protein [Planctomycetota bacterium]